MGSAKTKQKVKKEDVKAVKKEPSFRLNKDNFLKRKQINKSIPLTIKVDIDKTPEPLQEIRDPKNRTWYPIYSPHVNSYQMDLTFHRVKTKNNYMQAVLSIINTNTRFGFAQPMTYRGKRGDDDPEWLPTRKQRRAARKKIKGVNKDARTTLNAFVKALLYMNLWGRKVRRVSTDEGSEFKNNMMMAFCKDPMQYLCDHTQMWRKDYVSKWSEGMGYDPPLPFHRSKPSPAELFKGKFKIEPIELIILDARTGSKRRLSVIERFNRTIKTNFRKIGFFMTDKNESQWNKFRNDLATHYNFHSNHHGLSRFLIKHMAQDDAQLIKEEGISPADVDQDLEEFIISKKLEETQEADREHFDAKNAVRVGDKVRYRVTNPWDEEKNFPDAFLKKSYGWSKSVYTVVRRVRGGPNGGRTFIIEKDGEEHPRRFLPWELKVTDSPKDLGTDEDFEEDQDFEEPVVETVPSDFLEKLNKEF
jgi:hypothetical protein